jgi:hypothetical protein
MSKNISRTNSSFHSHVLGFIKSETLFRTFCPPGVIGLLVAPFGIQGSCQMFIFFFPFPSCHTNPLFRASTPCKIGLQEYVMSGLDSAIRRLPSRKYFVLRTCPDSGFYDIARSYIAN